MLVAVVAHVQGAVYCKLAGKFWSVSCKQVAMTFMIVEVSRSADRKQVVVEFMIVEVSQSVDHEQVGTTLVVA